MSTRNESPKTVTPPPHTQNMSKQLRLIQPNTTWRLDDETRQIGRQGIADARQALKDSRTRYAAPQAEAA
jgi:hypothetical protein